MFRNIISFVIAVCTLVIVASWIMERVEIGNFSPFARRGVVKQIDRIRDRVVSSSLQEDDITERSATISHSAGEKQQVSNSELDKWSQVSPETFERNSLDQGMVEGKSESDLETIARLPSDPGERNELDKEVVCGLDQRHIVLDDQDSNSSDGALQRNTLAETYKLLDNINKLLK